MNTKRIFLLLITIILLTGCKAKYNIYIDDNKINDNIELYEDSTKVNNATKEQSENFDDLIIDWERGYDYYKRELYI